MHEVKDGGCSAQGNGWRTESRMSHRRVAVWRDKAVLGRWRLELIEKICADCILTATDPDSNDRSAFSCTYQLSLTCSVESAAER